MEVKESVLCVNTPLLEQVISLQEYTYPMDEHRLVEILSQCQPQFIERHVAEHDTAYKQLIPYCLIEDLEGNFLAYQRKGNEKRLHGLWSLGVGGHINPLDSTTQPVSSLMDTLHAALERELYEEIGLKMGPEAYSCRGLMYESLSTVGQVHLGIVYVLKTDRNRITSGEELGTIQWIPAPHITRAIQDKLISFELWSELAYHLFQSS